MSLSTKTIITSCLLSILLWNACSMQGKRDGYTYNKKFGYYYKLLAFSDTYVTAHPGDVVSVRLAFCDNDSDTLYDERTIDVVARDEQMLSLSQLLVDLHTGDSILYMIPKKNIVENSFIPDVFWHDSASDVHFSLMVSAIVDSAVYADQKKERALWIQAKRDYETFLIQQYIKRTKEKFTQLRSGIYKRVIKQGRGNYLEIGDVTSISYQGSLLDGKIINHFTNLDFTFGAEYQVIKGIEIVLRTMKKGERSKIIVPSEFAWGELGSSDGSVPPYTPVVFDIELK
ncbi:MAG: FKBP-type peptidyl-prolyl cis-trans isomerase [Bacteroidales bacterium]|nr:FKBP-type peptidyl-prolyl cis-trans isomerase [Bacteroidales bacterium]